MTCDSVGFSGQKFKTAQFIGAGNSLLITLESGRRFIFRVGNNSPKLELELVLPGAMDPSVVGPITSHEDLLYTEVNATTTDGSLVTWRILRSN